MTSIRRTVQFLGLTLAVAWFTLKGQTLMWLGGRISARGMYAIDRACQLSKAFE